MPKSMRRKTAQKSRRIFLTKSQKTLDVEKTKNPFLPLKVSKKSQLF